ncbi:MAG: acyl-CoA dehydrogenase family protein [bacterium]|nr:acyl-CoA dehydrogenase family protein [bacterium]
MDKIEDSVQIRNTVKKLCAREIPKYQSENYYGTLPLPLFKSFASIGLTGLSISQDFAGLESSSETIAAVLEEVATIDLGPAIFLSVHLMVSRIIEKFSQESQKTELLPQLAEGKLLAAFGLTEASAGSDASALKTTATQRNDGFIINGSKCYITSAGWADIYIVFAKSGSAENSKEIAAFLVPAKTKGLIIGSPEKKMGCELSPIANLTFDNMHLPKEALLGSLDSGYKIALSGLAGGRINIAACANGLSQASLQIALDYLKEREQFGKPLIEMQGLQFMLADMQIKLETSRLITKKAAQQIDSAADQSLQKIFSSMAKCHATDCAMNITTEAVQLLGGAGYIKEYLVERYMRDAKMLQIVEGTNQIQRMVIAREMSKAGFKV